MKHRGFTLWFTGLSGSGKTTVSNRVHLRLQEMGVTNVEILDGEAVMRHLYDGHGFTREDVNRDTLRIGWVAHLLARNGVPSLVAAVSPFRESRDEVRSMVEHASGPGSFVEVHVDCPPEVCRERNPGGPAEDAGEPYEPPHHPEVLLKTDASTPDECAERVIEFLTEKGLVTP